MPKVLQNGLSRALILPIRLCFWCLLQIRSTTPEKDSMLPVAYLRKKARSLGSSFSTCACHARVLASVVKLGDESPWPSTQGSKEIYICWGTGEPYCNALGVVNAARLLNAPGAVNCARKAVGSRDNAVILLTSLVDARIPSEAVRPAARNSCRETGKPFGRRGWTMFIRDKGSRQSSMIDLGRVGWPSRYPTRLRVFAWLAAAFPIC